METLPHPEKPANYEYWIQNQEEAYPPSRTLGIYAEYVLTGKPWTWHERLVKRNGFYIRDVTFWVNPMTRRAPWRQPKQWVLRDKQSYENRLLHGMDNI